MKCPKMIMMKNIDKLLCGGNETASRVKVVAGVVHPYVGLELYETLDAITGFFFLDLKSDDWEIEHGQNKLRKLGRGLTNIIAGVTEIPINILDADKEMEGLPL